MDGQSNSLSGVGCRVVAIHDTYIEVETEHLTSFVSFFNKGAEVLANSNYNVWYALAEVTLASLKSNIGFYISVVYWGLYFLIGCLVMRSDRRKLADNRLQILFDATHPKQDNDDLDKTFESDASVYPVETF